MANITIVPAKVAGVTSAPSDGEEAKELEELWAYFLANLGVWAFWEGKDKAEMDAYKARANAYLRTRKEGALKLRQIRRQNLPEGQMKFIIEPATKGDE